MVLALKELLDIIITVVVASYIFSGVVQPMKRYETFGQKLLLTAYIVGPAIILHELAHKFIALAIGLQATLKAHYLFLGVGAVLKLVGFPFIFIVPAYVSVVGEASAFGFAMIALAGPLMNALLWLIAFLALKFGKFSNNTTMILHYSKMINGFLFILNLLPIPGFDGYHFWTGIF